MRFHSAASPQSPRTRFLIREIGAIRSFLFHRRGVKNPREGSAEEFSFSWDLRHGHGISGGSAQGAWIQSDRVGRKCLSAHVDVSSGKRDFIETGLPGGKHSQGRRRRGDRQRDEARQSGGGSCAEQEAPLPFITGSAEKSFSAR